MPAPVSRAHPGKGYDGMQLRDAKRDADDEMAGMPNNLLLVYASA
jgi:hypothetical protein